MTTAPPSPDLAEGPAPETEEGDEDLAARVARGMRWSVVSTVLGRVITPITSIVLAHLLIPEDFGVFSVALVVQNALLSVNDLGVTNAVVWWHGDVQKAARTATTLALASSSVLYLVCLLGAPVVADALGAPSATGVLRLLCLTVIIDGISSVPIGLLNREFLQARRTAADWSGFVVATGLTIGLAMAGWGPWSLAVGRVAGNTLTTTMLFVLARHRPRPGWDREVARPLIRYGLPLAASSLLVFAFLNADYLVVGRVLGATALGLYTIAFNLSSWPPNVLSQTVRRVSIPLFSRLRDDPAALDGAFLAGLRNLMVIALPVGAGLAVLGGSFLALAYPAEYQGAASVLTMLAVLGVARVWLDLHYDLLSGVGRTRVLFLLQLGWLAVLVPALALGANLGDITGVAVAHVIVALVVMVPAFGIAVGRAGIPLGAVARQLARPLAAAVLGAGAGALAVQASGPPLVALAAGGITLLVVYAALAASPTELRTLPGRLMRFEGAPR